MFLTKEVTMSPTQAILSSFKQYANVNGRASRVEFASFFIFSHAVFLIGFFVPQMLWKDILAQYDQGVLIFVSVAFFMSLYIPRLAVSFRRLHDLNLPSIIYLVLFIPFLGQIGFFLMFVLKGNKEQNRYGDNPLNGG